MSTEPCPTCMQPVPVPQRGDHDYGIPLVARADALDVDAIAGIRAAALDEYVANAEPTVRRLIEAAYKKGLTEARADALDVEALARLMYETEPNPDAHENGDWDMASGFARDLFTRWSRAILAARKP